VWRSPLGLHIPLRHTATRPLRGPARHTVPGVRNHAQHAAQAAVARPWRARTPHRHTPAL